MQKKGAVKEAEEACTELQRQLKARDAELKESLEQQAATLEILRVIGNSPTDTQPVFDAVAESAARLCEVHDVSMRLVEGNVHRAVAHHGPIPTMAPRPFSRGTIIGRALVDARTVHVPDVAEAHVREEYPETVTVAAGYRSFVAVPLVRENKAIGVILMRRLEVRPFTDKQIRLLETFAAQAVIAIENVRLFHEIEDKKRQLEIATARMEAELESAREIQLAMVPGEFPEPTAEASAEIFATLHPARQVGGDLYDFFYMAPHTLCLVIGDVAGKGAPAALFMAQTNSMIRLVATLLRAPGGGHCGPAEIIAKVNEQLCRGNTACMFVTMFLAILDLKTRTLLSCSAGHPFPYVIDRVPSVTRIQGDAGLPLGIEAEYHYEQESHALSRGDCLFLYTDGVTEAMDREGAFFTEQRLEDTLRPFPRATPREVVEQVIASVRQFAAGAEQADDITAMAVRV